MRHFLRAPQFFGPLFTVLVLIGCSTTDESLKPVPLVNFDETVKVERVWSRSVTKGGNHDVMSRFYVAVLDDHLYVADYDGNAKGVSLDTGKVVWKTQVGTKLGGATGAAYGKVFLGSLEGEVITLNAEDGAELWRQTVSSEVVTPPQANRDVVLVTTIDGRLVAFDVATGEKRWSYDHPLPVLTYRSQAKPVVTGSQAYIAFDNGQLMSFDTSDGQLRWSVRVSQPQGTTELERAVDLDASPLLDGPFVYSAGANGRVVAINNGTGRIIWGQNVSTFYDMALVDDVLVVTNEDSHVYGYDSSTGALLWENDKLHRRGVKAPGELGENIALIDDDGYMHVLAAKDGAFSARIKPAGSRFSSPMTSLDDGSVLILSDEGKLSRYRIKGEASE